MVFNYRLTWEISGCMTLHVLIIKVNDQHYGQINTSQSGLLLNI